MSESPGTHSRHLQVSYHGGDAVTLTVWQTFWPQGKPMRTRMKGKLATWHVPLDDWNLDPLGQGKEAIRLLTEPVARPRPVRPPGSWVLGSSPDPGRSGATDGSHAH